MRENAIKESAMYMLLKKGQFDCTINDIAKEAKISHSVVHYYYRTKEMMMSKIFMSILEDLIAIRYNILFEDSDLELKERIGLYIESSLEKLEIYPYLDLYILTQLKKPDYLKLFLNRFTMNFDGLFSEIRKDINRGKITHLDPRDFISDLFTMTNYIFLILDFFDTTKIGKGIDLEDDKSKIKQKIMNRLYPEI